MNFSKLKTFMDDMAAHHTPGNAIEVYVSGKQVFRYAAGYSDLERKLPLTGEEMFNIYSCSKVATVTAGVQLLEQGKFRLEDPLYDYIPEFREMYVKQEDGSLVKAKNHITVHDLFTMGAGFSYDRNTPGFQRAAELTGGKMDTVEVARCMAADPLHYQPGIHWRYSLGHDVLAALIGVVSGKKFRDYMKEHIFDPLEMKDTVYHQTEETLLRTAPQYIYVADSGTELDLVEAQRRGPGGKGYFKPAAAGKGNTLVFGEEYDSGGAGIVTTVSDYAKLMAALGNYGLGPNGERILSPVSVDLMRTNRLNAQQQMDWDLDWPYLVGYGYGLGVATQVDPIRSKINSNPGEFGWGGAAGSTAFADPKIGLGVFYAQHTMNPREEYYQPRLKNAVYSCLK